MRAAGGAHRGLGPWLWQRASALWMALFLTVFLLRVLASGPLDYAAWRGLFEPLAAKIGMLLFVSALLLHAWIGLREVLIDYLHPLALRLPLYFVFALLYSGCLIWTADILWGIK